MKILIVDDNRDDRTVLRYMIEKNGHEAVEAGDGREGLEKAKAGPPDLIISDALMPVMDGFQFLREVKQSPLLRQVPFIFYSSAYRESQDLRLAMSMGADAYILKPMEPVDLWKKIQEILKVREKVKFQPVPIIEEDAEYLKRYSEVVATKLEEKVRELEQTLDALRESEEKFSSAFQSSPSALSVSSMDFVYLDVNERFLEMTGYARQEILGHTRAELNLWAEPDQWKRFIQLLQEQESVRDFEYIFRCKDGSIGYGLASATRITINGELCILAQTNDITGRKKAEQERLSHLKFFESMDKVNRAIQATNDLDHMMREVLDSVLSIFDCDRAFLLYPCDPGAASWKSPMERTRPEYPGILTLGLEMPMDAEVAGTLRILLDSDGPVKFGPGTGHSLPAEVSERFGFKSFMSMALYPKTGKPWQFGIHQCSYPRVWTGEEERLLREIGRRLSDALTGLLTMKDLQLSEKRFRALVDGAPDAILVYDLGLDRFVDANANAEKLFGCGRDELLKHPPQYFYESKQPDGRPPAETVYEHSMETMAGKSPVFERVVHNAEGRDIICEVRLSQLPSADRKLIRASYIDITKRIKADSLMRKLTTAVEQSPVTIIITDREGTIEYVNPKFIEVTGYSYNEIIGNTPRIIKSGNTPDEVYKNLWATITAGKIWRGIFQNRKKNGELYWESTIIAPIINENGMIESFIGIKEDITDRKRTEEDLVLMNERFILATRAAHMGVWDWDIQKKELIWDDRMYELYGVRREDFPGAYETWLKGLHPDDRASSDEISKQAQRGEREYDTEFRVVWPDGSIHYLKAYGQFVRDADGKPLRMTGINFDITELKVALEELNRLNEDLEKRVNERTSELEYANRELEAFTYSVSHDLRAPLRAIDGFSSFLLKDYEDKLDDEGKRLIDVIRKSTRTMDRLIIDLLSLSRVTKGEIRQTRIDMRALASSICNEMANANTLKNHEIIVDPMPYAWGDAILIRQVWFNLISNAVKFTMKSDLKRVKIGGYKDEDENVYFVKDTGVGFNPEYAHKLFGVFKRLHKSEDFEGNGVGLAIVQRIILRHKGRVWAEGKENTGATFYFTLSDREDQ